MLKTIMASALIITATLSVSTPFVAESLHSLEPRSYKVATTGMWYVCSNNGFVSLRTTPSTRYSRIIKIPNGRSFEILNDSSYRNWWKIWYRGRIGWINNNHICWR